MTTEQGCVPTRPLDPMGLDARGIDAIPAQAIPAHSHRDDRMATVVSGSWQFGYGEVFDEQALKRLPPGSVYSEPGGANHFARTDAEPVLVEISGVGPTDTRYVDPADAPKRPGSR